MIRHTITPRKNWQTKVRDVGLTFHTINNETYWDEGHFYEFTSEQIDDIEYATQQCHNMCLDAVREVIRSKDYKSFGLDERFIPLIEDSWYRDKDKSIYGRFDFSYNGDNEPKMLECNADTPTALLEASIAQWFWLQDVFPNEDQFNSIDEKLLATFSNLRIGGTLHVSSVDDSEEDFMTVTYLRDVAERAGLTTKYIAINDIGWNKDTNQFVDLEELPIHSMFKLYPWEWLVKEEFGANILRSSTKFYEPAWKMLLSNKAILVKLWQMFSDSPYILPAGFTPEYLGGRYVKKPILSREGANVSIITPKINVHSDGIYGDVPCIYQKFQALPEFTNGLLDEETGVYPVIGSWIVGNTACGIGIREDNNLITKNTSRFVPHLFKG